MPAAFPHISHLSFYAHSPTSIFGNLGILSKNQLWLCTMLDWTCWVMAYVWFIQFCFLYDHKKRADKFRHLFKKSLCNSLKLYKNSYTKTITWLLFLCNITKFSSLDVPIKSLNILDAKQLCGLSSVHMDRKREKSIRLYTGPLFWHTIAG